MKQLAKELGISYEEHEQKHLLIEKISKIRKQKGLTQEDLAKKLGVSQSRIARIESRLGVSKVSFDMLFRILAVLGYRCTITPRKVSSSKLAA